MGAGANGQQKEVTVGKRVVGATEKKEKENEEELIAKLTRVQNVLPSVRLPDSTQQALALNNRLPSQFPNCLGELCEYLVNLIACSIILKKTVYLHLEIFAKSIQQ